MIELFEKEKALLVTVDVFSLRSQGMKIEDEKQELRELVKTAGLEIVDEVICHYDKPSPSLFIGSGKAAELNLVAAQLRIDVVVFSVDLSGTQARNLEEKLGCKVIDRTQLILDIFALHAKSPEGKMQVELAQLEYLLPRLTGKGTMLSRLGGGIGTRGPGEQKLELDRRRIRSRITRLKGDLEKVHSHRELIRKKRKEDDVPLVSFVGYTNAGKTTLLNSLVNEHQLADDSLFTTLDPLSRTLVLPNHQKVVISDTVGFLHNLPHHLIEAFKATLEDVREADLLIHVLDIAHPLRYSYYQSVNTVLQELNCQDKPTITVLNKVDKLEDASWLERYKIDFPNSVALSALKKENLDGFLALISQKVSNVFEKVELSIPLDKMSLVDLIYREGKVEKVRYTSKSVIVSAFLPATVTNKLSSYVNRK
ncbi:MAG: GTPase HflX [Omnitrophica WOR_2 bacterium GWF2_43_52]|nr:MAG: GTPase HflX [Omnitrophica WOR_2 bacterium GWC2_44_8]OGX21116.1 MAG: GTPase HflX [Omnitrophica WOR_2 bacterium GWF2_43_52]HAH19946.1 GTPase HflX [Candidatus Omnitrophota bacterium]HBG62935.1 GTPase HflX [Candidatus Omnitrophota bacterium]HCD38185.1 GTPase HflX [Candidatus Omnitrophota bacterium]